MLQNMKGLQIKGRSFISEKQLEFWKQQNCCFSLLYGRNGCGKTTVSDAFNFLKDGVIADFEKIDSLTFDGSVFSNEDKQKIFVFNEKFIDQNIKVKEDGIGSIVMFGHQVEIDAKIEREQQKLVEIGQKLLDDSALCEEYSNSKNEKSPDYYLNKCTNFLKKDSGWAQTDSLLRGKRQNTAVSVSTVEMIARCDDLTKNLSELQKEYEKNKKLYDSISLNEKKIEDSIALFNFTGHDSKAKNVLLKKIEKPELTEREKKIFEFIKNKGQYLLNEAKRIFKNDDIDYCPYCYQPISEEYKQSLMENFKKVLNKETDEYIAQLEKLKINEVHYSLEKYRHFDQELIQSCNLQFERMNKEIKKFNQIVDSRINNIYKEFLEESYSVNIENESKLLNAELLKLNREKEIFNHIIDNRSELCESLIEMNNKIASKQMKAYYELYLQKKDEKKQAEEKKQEDENIKKQLEDGLNLLKSQLKNISIAEEHINKLLKYVFFDDQRMNIQIEDGLYQIKSLGHSVKPNKISCGERNILALCYFFTNIFSQKKEDSTYTSPYLLVIDDPVSSYDRENQIGVMSLMKYELSNFASSNSESKFLIMTHDLKSFFDMQKIADEICKKTGKSYEMNEIADLTIKQFSYKKRNEYSEFLKKAFLYATNQNNEVDSYIGNTLRKIIEFYSTFLYKLGIEEISLNEDVLSLLPNKEQREYFENLMYRLVLHGESHMEERVRSLDDFCGNLTEAEKRRIAKDVLCFLYLMNPLHVKRHLEGLRDVEQTLNNWCNRIG